MSALISQNHFFSLELSDSSAARSIYGYIYILKDALFGKIKILLQLLFYMQVSTLLFLGLVSINLANCPAAPILAFPSFLQKDSFFDYSCHFPNACCSCCCCCSCYCCWLLLSYRLKFHQKPKAISNES